MPSSPLLAHSGLAVIGSIVFLVVFAGLLTTLVSVVLLAAYRARVGRLMTLETTASGGGAEARSGSARDATPGAQSDRAANAADLALQHASGEALYRVTREGQLRLAGRYAVAGTCYALIVGTAAYFAFSRVEVNYLRAAAHPLQFAVLLWVAAWPIVMAIAVVVASGRWRWAAVAGYFAIFGLIGAALSTVATEAPLRLGEVTLPGWSGESPLRLAAKWGVFNAAPTLLIVVFRHRRLRAVAPLVLAFVTVVGVGLLAAVAFAFAHGELSTRSIAAVSRLLDIEVGSAALACLAALALGACLVFAAAGWLVVIWICRRHERKVLSDQSLAIASQSMVFAAFHAGILAYGGPGWALAPLAGLAAFHLAFRPTAPAADVAGAPSLLVLRVFSLGRQSELLFDAVTGPWRHAGSVTLIAGTDLATTTVAPRQFLAFLSGRLNRLFIRSPADAAATLQTLDRGSDADGRFRVNDCFCSADSWRSMLTHLVARADVVMMDLRRFSAANAGCVFEIQALLHAIPSARLVFVVDDATDRTTFGSIVQNTCAALPPGAINAGLSATEVTCFSMQRLRAAQVRELLHALCRAAGARGAGTRAHAFAV